MFTVIRNYAGARTLVDELTKRRKDVEELVSTVPGFISYYLIRTEDGAASITVCENRAGCDESSKRAAKWIGDNLPNLKVAPPQIIAGELAFKFAHYPSQV